MTEEKTRLDNWRELYVKEPGILDAIVKACEEHGDRKVVVIDTDAGTAIFKAPNGAQYKRFTSLVLNDSPEKKATAATNLVRDAVVFPDKVTWDKWVEEFPAIPSGCLKKVTGLAGSEVKERGKD